MPIDPNPSREDLDPAPASPEEEEVFGGPSHALTRGDAEAGLPAPLAAMAEALRANAEALQRLDDGQRRIAETMERADKAGQVVTSTRALNETFRGLSEIQRGLLDAVVRSRRGGGGTGLIAFGILVSALIGALLGALVWDRLSPEPDPGPARAELVALKDAGARSERELAELKAQGREAERRERSLRAELKDRAAELAAARRGNEELKKHIQGLESDATGNKAKLENFVFYKQQADRAGELTQSNLILAQEKRRLQEKVDRLEKEREKLYGWMGDKLLEMKGGDPEAILRAAEEKGLFKKPEPAAKPDADGPVVLDAGRERVLKGAINRLLPDDDQSFQVVRIGAVENRYRFRDVVVARYRVGRLVSQIVCSEMTIHLDAKRGTIELRCKNGKIVSSGKKGGEIPIGESGHSEFLENAGIANWLRRSRAIAEIDEKGRLAYLAGR